MDDGADDAGDPGECEAKFNACYTAKWDTVMVKEGVDYIGEDRDGDDDGEGLMLLRRSSEAYPLQLLGSATSGETLVARTD